MLKWWQCPNDNRHVLEAHPRWSENLYCKFCENTRAIFSDKAEIKLDVTMEAPPSTGPTDESFKGIGEFCEVDKREAATSEGAVDISPTGHAEFDRLVRKLAGEIMAMDTALSTARARLAEVERERDEFRGQLDKFKKMAFLRADTPYDKVVEHYMRVFDSYYKAAEAAEARNGELEKERDKLRSALERLLRGAELYMKCRPWRDADECFSEARAALEDKR